SSRRRNYATFLLHAPPTSYISTLSLHDALPICHRANDDPCSQREQRSARVAEIAIQCGHRGHRIVVEIELMLVDQACEAIDRKRSEEHTSELQSLRHLVCRLLLEKKNTQKTYTT